jgi:glycosyltransferase involved in cell wall biosynthesis
MPKVTTIIANHNYGEYLESAIESALAQTHPDTMVAVCDDASTDHSQDVLKKYRKNKRVDVVINNERFGPSYTRNRIISRHLDSDYFMILDSDDVMHSTKVERMLNVFGVNENVGAVYADYDILNPQNNLAIREFKPTFSRERLFQDCIVHSGSMISNKALLNAKLADDQFYDNSMLVCEDYDLWLRVSANNMIIHLPEILTVVRVTPKNSSTTVPSEIWQKNWAIINERIKTGYYK